VPFDILSQTVVALFLKHFEMKNSAQARSATFVPSRDCCCENDGTIIISANALRL
jgi:hypothetical protein